MAMRFKPKGIASDGTRSRTLHSLSAVDAGSTIKHMISSKILRKKRDRFKVYEQSSRMLQKEQMGHADKE